MCARREPRASDQFRGRSVSVREVDPTLRPRRQIDVTAQELGQFDSQMVGLTRSASQGEEGPVCGVVDRNDLVSGSSDDSFFVASLS